MSRLAESLYGPGALRRTGVLSAVLVMAIFAVGAIDIANGDRPRGVKLLVLGAALSVSMAIGLYLRWKRRRDAL